MPSSGAIALRPSEASAGDAALLRDQRHAERPDAEPAPLLGQVRRVEPALARAVAQALDDVPARQHVGRVGDLGLGGQRVLLDVRPDAVEQVAQLGRERRSRTPPTIAHPHAAVDASAAHARGDP